MNQNILTYNQFTPQQIALIYHISKSHQIVSLSKYVKFQSHGIIACCQKNNKDINQQMIIKRLRTIVNNMQIRLGYSNVCLQLYNLMIESDDYKQLMKNEKQYFNLMHESQYKQIGKSLYGNLKYKKILQNYQQNKKKYDNYCIIMANRKHFNRLKQKITNLLKKYRYMYQNIDPNLLSNIKINIQPINLVPLFILFPNIYRQLLINMYGQIFIHKSNQQMQKQIGHYKFNYKFEILFHAQQNQLSFTQWKTLQKQKTKIINHYQFQQICKSIDQNHKITYFTNLYQDMYRKQHNFVYLLAKNKQFQQIRQQIQKRLNHTQQIRINYILNKENRFVQFWQSKFSEYSVNVQYNELESVLKIKMKNRKDKNLLIKQMKNEINDYLKNECKMYIFELDQVQYEYFNKFKNGVIKLLQLQEKFYIKFQILSSSNSYQLSYQTLQRTYFNIKLQTKQHQPLYHYLTFKSNRHISKLISIQLNTILQNIYQYTTSNISNIPQFIFATKFHQNIITFHIQNTSQNIQLINQFNFQVIQSKKYISKNFISQYQKITHPQSNHLDDSFYQFQQQDTQFINQNQKVISTKIIPLLPKIWAKLAYFQKISKEYNISIKFINNYVHIKGYNHNIQIFINILKSQSFLIPVQWQNSSKFQLKPISFNQNTFLQKLLNQKYKFANRIQNIHSRRIWEQKIFQLCNRYNNIGVIYVYILGKHLTSRINSTNQTICFQSNKNGAKHLKTYLKISNRILQENFNFKEILVCQGIVTEDRSNGVDYIIKEDEIEYYKQNLVLPLYMINL